MGDLNYRVSLSYEETRSLLEGHDWDTLLEKDQVCFYEYNTKDGIVYQTWYVFCYLNCMRMCLVFLLLNDVFFKICFNAELLKDNL